MSDVTRFTHPYPVAALARRKPTRFRLEPDASERAAVAAELGILGIERLSFQGEIRPSGGQDWDLDATLTARVAQACVITLDPVVNDISEQVRRRYLARMPDPEGDEVEMPEDDTAEPLPGIIDAGSVLTEALALALPPWPRAKGAELGSVAVTAPGSEPLTDAEIRPFARLGDMLKKPPETP
jgi:uncharacterized metal-binding protein YceD (DUF177 family)